MTLDRLRTFGETRSRWSLILAGVQLAVLVASGAAAYITGFVGFLALGAAWMFLIVRVSRSVVGDRALDRQVGSEVKRRILTEDLHGGLPSGLEEHVVALDQHRKVIPWMSAGMALVFGMCCVGGVVPTLNVWAFGLAAVCVVGGVGWAWSRRKGWARSRALVDAWAEQGGRSLQPVNEPPALTVVEGGKGDHGGEGED